MTSLKQRPIAACVASLCSGVAALAYEVAWAKMLVVPLGNTSDAVAVVLASFMVGLSAGAWVFGAAADRVHRPFRLYAAIEAALCAAGFLVPVLIGALDAIPALRGSFAQAPAAALLRYAAAFLVVGIPSTLMGAAVPALVRAASSQPGDPAHRIGPIYGLNTAGAAAGAAAVGLAGIPMLGLQLSSQVAAGFNALAALVAWWAPSPGAPERPAPADPAREPAAASHPARATAALVGAATSGFVVLGLEGLWARALAFPFGFDAYAFAALLAVVLLGLGTGGLAQRLVAHRDPATVLAGSLALLACSTPGGLWAASQWFQAAVLDPGGALPGPFAALAGSRIRLELAYASVLAFVPSLLAGAAFPAACSLFGGPTERAGGRIGAVTLLNGLAATLGALVSAFLLAPLLGVQQSIVSLSGLAAVAAAAVLLLAGAASLRRRAAWSGAAVAAAVVSFLAVPAGIFPSMLLASAGPRHQEVLFFREGRVNTVAVLRDTVNAEKKLYVNSIVEVSTRLVHQQSFKLLGHLGFLLHPDPRSALAVCLGGGLSPGAALRHGIPALDVAEIDPTVPQGTRWFAEENNRVLDDPRFRLHVADGRQLLRNATGLYDVVFIDSTHPKAMDSWLLYTSEFYDLVRGRLAPGGFAVQWVPLHGLSEREFRIIVRTFLEVFPEATLWANVGLEVHGPSAYALLVATTGPLAVDYGVLAARLAQDSVRKDLEPWGMAEPAEILDCFVAGPAELRRWTAGLPVQVDDRPLIPYRTAYSSGRAMSAAHFLDPWAEQVPFLAGAAPSADAAAVVATARQSQRLLWGGRLGRAREVWPEGRKLQRFEQEAAGSPAYYGAVAGRYGGDPGRLLKLGRTVDGLGHPGTARKIYEQALLLRPGDAALRNGLATSLTAMGEFQAALQIFSEVLTADPDDSAACVNVGLAYGNLDEHSTSAAQLETCRERFPHLDAQISYYLGEARYLLGELDAAERDLRRAAAADPAHAAAWALLGRISIARGQPAEARDRLQRAVTANPFHASSWYDLGNLHLSAGENREAIRCLDAALLADGAFGAAYNSRGIARAQDGDARSAVLDFTLALEQEPAYAVAYVNRARAYADLGEYRKAWEDVEAAERASFDVDPAFLERLHRASPRPGR